jgi:luciferase-type oxidoreductase
MDTISSTNDLLDTHIGFKRTFQSGQLTIGFVSPAEGYPDSPIPGLSNQPEIVRMLDDIDAAALWLRDVPLYDPGFGDAGQVFDPLVYAAWLAAMTSRIAVGTAGIVLPLRDPIITTKQILTADHLLKGRFITGLASGDRAKEYPAIGVDFASRADRYREGVTMLRSLAQDTFPSFETRYHGVLRGDLDLLPKPLTKAQPIIAIGRAGQSLEWLSENTDGWIWHGLDARQMTKVIPQWRSLTPSGGFKPYGYGVLFDLDANPDAPLHTGRILRGGRNALIEFFADQREAGVNHVALSLKPTRRPALEVLEEMGKYVIPEFKVSSG